MYVLSLTSIKYSCPLDMDLTSITVHFDTITENELPYIMQVSIKYKYHTIKKKERSFQEKKEGKVEIL